MENFSWVFSVIIPAISGFIPSVISYFLGVRSEKNKSHNQIVDELDKRLDTLFSTATQMFEKTYNDADYHYMVYEFDNLKTVLSKLNNGNVAVFELSTLKRILTDHLFHKKEKITMESLSSQIQVIKKNINKKYL